MNKNSIFDWTEKKGSLHYEKGQLIKCLKLPVSIVELGGHNNSVFSVNSCLFEFVRTDYNLTEYGEPVVEGRIAK